MASGDRNLEQMARRVFLVIARTGSSIANGSGDYAIAFTIAAEVRRTVERRRAVGVVGDLSNDQVSLLFQAVAEATEEAVYNAMLQAVTTTGYRGHRLDALAYEAVRDSLDRHGFLAGAR